MKRTPKGATSVMARRVEPPDSLEFFPTPPWATRALLTHLIGDDRRSESVWEPACGEGHMASVLAEAFGTVIASDVHDYGFPGQGVGSFIGQGPDVMPPSWPHWIITNPPFGCAIEFAERALGEAQTGVALLLRSGWLEGVDRYDRVFSRTPPSIVGQFAERVPMVKGRWDPEASTATAYVWFVWLVGDCSGDTHLRWIPPGCREQLTMPDDVRRFTRPAGIEGQQSWI